MTSEDLSRELRAHADKKQAVNLQRFFKTGKGEYAEGDIFLGLKVPTTRSICKKFVDLSQSELRKSLRSVFHEERLAALLILVAQAKMADDKMIKTLCNFYLTNTKWINNWDLVDLSAEHVVGKNLFEKDKNILFKLAGSTNLWERRISIISTFYFIKRNKFDTSFQIIEMLLSDKHDLIHKACGWMLREIGKNNFDAEFNFLKTHYARMPRTMLRYAIEKFPEELRQKILHGEI